MTSSPPATRRSRTSTRTEPGSAESTGKFKGRKSRPHARPRQGSLDPTLGRQHAAPIWRLKRMEWPLFMLNQQANPHPIPHPPPLPPPPNPRPRFANFARFLGYFRAARANSQPQQIRSYSQVVQAASKSIVMVYPVCNRGGGRDGFGAGRFGRGAGRTGGRYFVWHRSDGLRREEGQGVHGHNGANPGAQQHAGAAGRECGEGDGRSSNEAWDRAAQQTQVQDQTTLEDGEIKVGKDKKVNMADSEQLPESSKNAERRTPGWRDGRGETGCRYCGLKNHRSEDCM